MKAACGRRQNSCAMWQYTYTHLPAESKSGRRAQGLRRPLTQTKKNLEYYTTPRQLEQYHFEVVLATA
ncbi:hypothetical protein DWUX_732 [Desulfovibrio diazotrophicus]|nr:hypothetical protein DWUX_732 [Desulfovibrio diazotrophicus]